MSLPEARHLEIIESFSSCEDPEATYGQIMNLGKQQQELSIEEKKSENLVPGCQTQLYLISRLEDGKIYFKAQADALISAGLAQLLVWFYNGLTCEEVLKAPPTFLQELNIPGSLTPSRTNGLYSIHLRMKQEALKGLVTQRQ